MTNWRSSANLSRMESDTRASNPLYWPTLLGTCNLGVNLPVRFGTRHRGKPCPGPVRMFAQGLLREAFRAGNWRAALAAEWLEIEGVSASPLWFADASSVSVLIPVRGAHAQLALCLRALERCVGLKSRLMEVVIACPASESNDVNSIAGRWRPWLTRVVSSAEPLGFPANVNFARRCARGSTLVLLNSDAYVTEGWLDALLEPLLDSAVLATGPSRQVEPPEDFDPRAEDGLDRVASMSPRLTGDPYKARRLVGFCLAVRATAFDAIGGLCEDFGIGNYDDDDLSTRLLLYGGQDALVAVPSCTVVHQASSSFRELPDATATYRAALERGRALYNERWGWLLPDLHRALDAAGVAPAEHFVQVAP